MKNFYQYLLKYDPNINQINQLLGEFLTGKSKSKERLASEILNENDINKLISAVNSPRDKAVISLLADSGIRVSELLNLKHKHISHEEGDMYVTIELGSKNTSGRKILLIPSVPYLSAWLNYSQFKNHEDFIFVGLDKKNYGKQLAYSSISKILQTARKKANITKCCSPHAFRRASATMASSFLSDTSLMQRYGWRKRETISVYTKLNPSLVDDSYRRMYGKSRKESNESGLLKPIYCKVCRTLQNCDNTICNTCGNPLNQINEQGIAWDILKDVLDDELRELIRKKVEENELRNR